MAFNDRSESVRIPERALKQFSFSDRQSALVFL